MKRNLIALATTLLMVSGCSDSNFKGASPSKKHTEDATPHNRSIQLTCDETTDKSTLSTEFSSEKPVQVQIEGEICGIKAEQVEKQLTVLFVLDFSGSMRLNDELVNGSCGRYNAAQAIVNKMQDVADTGVSISMGAVQFGNNALTHVPMNTLDAFKTSVTAENFCGDAAGSTNYQAALEEAQTQLQAIQGRKLIYFITDGAPTAPVSPEVAQTSGLDAATALKNIQELTFNAIYIQGAGGIGDIDPTFNPQQYLEQLVGAPERVKLVASATDLAAEITQFESPDPVVLDTNSANTTHVAASFGEKPVKLERFEQHPTREGVWTFVTEPILLFAAKGETVSNEIFLEVATSDGETHEARVKIEFEQTKALTK